MPDESPPSPAASRAIFLSYASQDTEAAQRICAALRSAGVEVWFDQNELVGGDAWDAKIRKQIAECALFVPIISAATQARREGYFRLEWRLAAQRTHMMSEQIAFLLPVVIDATRDAEADVPTEFKAVQWTRLPAGEAPEKFCARVKKLLGGEVTNVGPVVDRAPAQRAGLQPKPSRAWLMPAALAVAAVVALALWQPWKESAPASTAPATTPPAPLTEAQQLVAKARKILEEGDEMNHEDYFLADDLLKKAVALDATDGDVWAAQAEVSAEMVMNSYDRSALRQQNLRMQAERAVKLAPDSTEAKLAYAFYLTVASFLTPNGEHFASDAVASVQKLNLTSAQQHRAGRVRLSCMVVLGKLEEWRAAVERAGAPERDDPRLLGIAATQFLFSGRYAEAEDFNTRAMALRRSGRNQIIDVLLKLVWRGDLDGAAAALAEWPSWLALEDRGVFVTTQVWLWRHEPEKALAVLAPVSRDFLNDSLFVGPKAVLVALAQEMAGNAQAARAAWEDTKRVATRVATDQTADQRALVWKAVAMARLGETTEAETIFRQLEQSKILRSEFWSCTAPSALLRIALGHGDEVVAKFDKELRSNSVRTPAPSPQAALRLNPVFDPIRATPEFQKWLAAAPAPKASVATAPPAAPISEARKLVLQARALIDDDWLAVRENFRNADDLCERATKLDPLDGEAWATWSRVAVEMIIRSYDVSPQRMEAARSRAERALQLAPDSVEGQLALALVLRQNQSAKDAIQRLRALLARAPTDARVARALAAALSPPGAKADPEATDIRLNHPAFGGKDPRPLMDESRTMHDSQRFFDCERLGERVATMAPCLESYRFRIVYPGFSINDLEAARTAIEQTPARLMQEDVFAGLAAWVWIKLGKPDNALAVLRRVPRDYLEDIWVSGAKGYIAGRAHALAGRSAAAQAEWSQAIKVIDQRLVAQPNEPHLLAEKAQLLALVGQKEEAEKTWQLAAELRRWPRGETGLLRSEILLAEGETEEAIKTMVSNLTPVVGGRVLLTVNMIHTNPWFAPVREDPRIKQLLADGDALIRKFREKPTPAVEKK